MIPGAVAAAGVLVVMVVAVLRTSWRAFEPATGTSWQEYLVGVGIAVLTVIVAGLGVLWLPPAQGRPARQAAGPVSPRPSRGRR